MSLPHVPGHEFVGRVIARGSQVRRLQVGQRIITPFVCGCGRCPQCVAGQAQVCPHQTQPGFTHWGSFAEQVQVRHADFNAIVAGDHLDPAALVGLGCRFATSFAALHHRGQVRAGERVAVFGAGGVGLSAVMIGAALGAEMIAVDTCPQALDRAREAGATHVVQSGGLPATGRSPRAAASPAAEVAEQVRRFGAVQVSVDALGHQDTATAALYSLAPRGRHVQIGLFDAEPVLPVSRIIAQEITFLGSHGMAAADYQPMLDLIATGRLRPQDLVTRRLTLAEAPAAVVQMGEHPHPGITMILPGTDTGTGTRTPRTGDPGGR